MSQLSSQPALVANRALSLPAGPSTGFTLEQRDRARLIIDTARAQSETGQRTAGLVGQGAARTGQLLNAPLTPGVRTASSSPVAANPLQEALEAIDAGMNAPTLLQQFGGGPVSTRDARQLILESRREFQGRSSDVAIIRRARLRQDILNQQVAERREARVERADIRSELSQQLSFDREARIKDEQDRVRTTAARKFRLADLDNLEDTARSLGITRKDLGQAVKFGLMEGFVDPVLTKNDLLGQDQRVFFEQLASRFEKDPGLKDEFAIRLSGKPKRTAAEVRRGEKDVALGDFVREVAKFKSNPKAANDPVERRRLLELVLKIDPDNRLAQALFAAQNSGLTGLVDDIESLMTLGLRASGLTTTTTPNSLEEADVDRRAKAEAELNF